MQTNPIHAEEIAAMDVRIEMVYAAIKGSIDWNSLVPTILTAASTLESMSELKGAQRLDILQKTLRHALKDSDLPAVKKEEILHTIETVVPIVAQAAVLASKSPIADALLKSAQSSCFCWKK
jgi:hypothetical protein